MSKTLDPSPVIKLQRLHNIGAVVVIVIATWRSSEKVPHSQCLPQAQGYILSGVIISPMITPKFWMGLFFYILLNHRKCSKRWCPTYQQGYWNMLEDCESLLTQLEEKSGLEGSTDRAQSSRACNGDRLPNTKMILFIIFWIPQYWLKRKRTLTWPRF